MKHLKDSSESSSHSSESSSHSSGSKSHSSSSSSHSSSSSSGSTSGSSSSRCHCSSKYDFDKEEWDKTCVQDGQEVDECPEISTDFWNDIDLKRHLKDSSESSSHSSSLAHTL